MSDTTEAGARRIREESPVVDAVCRQLSRQSRGRQGDLLVSFAEIFFSRAPASFLTGRSPDTLAHLVRGTFDFLNSAKPGQVDVQRPFIVDSLREFLNARHLPIETNVYPVLHVERGEDGQILEMRPSREGERRESLVHCEIARVADEEALEEIQEEIRRRLEDVVLATDDFQPMVSAVDETIAELEKAGPRVPEDRRDEVEEARAFLKWLKREAFVFLGYRTYDLVELNGERCVAVQDGSGLGPGRGRPGPDHQQDQRRVHRPPASPDGLHRGQALRRGRQNRR